MDGNDYYTYFTVMQTSVVVQPVGTPRITSPLAPLRWRQSSALRCGRTAAQSPAAQALLLRAASVPALLSVPALAAEPPVRPLRFARRYRNTSAFTAGDTGGR